MSLTALLLVIGGLALLLVSGDLLVRGAVALARKLRIPPLLIGLTVVAFGTSAPELFVGVDAAIVGGDAIGIALGNVVGSNIANVLVVLGLAALFATTACAQTTIRRNTVMMVAASLFFILLCADASLNRVEGLLLFGLILAWVGYSARRAQSARRGPAELEEIAELDDISGLPGRPSVIAAFIAAALVGLPLGAHLIVSGGVELARAAGVPPSVIGLSLVAVGTSLPELATTVLAAMRKHAAVALGNVIGSNIFNLLAIMGVTALVAGRPIAIEERMMQADLWIMLASSALILPYVLLRLPIGRLSGAAFLCAYGAWLAFLFTSGVQT